MFRKIVVLYEIYSKRLVTEYFLHVSVVRISSTSLLQTNVREQGVTKNGQSGRFEYRQPNNI